MSTKKPLLTISLLISNRPDTIPRCLDSLRPIMDEIPSELILIDTSKSEEIHTLLLTYTDKVYEFEWCKDFAKARNEGVRRAKGKWFLYLDDDEWFDDVEDILHFFKSGLYKKNECANITIRNFLNLEYTEYTDSWGTRLFYLGKGAKFEGKIHEYVYPIYQEPIFLQSIANHSGYVFETEEEKRAHFERNMELLLKTLEEEPSNLRWVSQLIQEYRTEKDWESIVDLCKKYIAKIDEPENYMEQNHLCTLYAGLVEGLTNLKKYKKALEVCEIALVDERRTDLLESFIHYYAAFNYKELEKWEKASVHIEKYFEGYEYYKKNKENMNEQFGALLVHRVFENNYLEKASNFIMYSELKKENIEIPLAEEGEQKEAHLDALTGAKFVKAMVKLMATMEYKHAFEYFIKNMEQNETICEWACAEAQQWEQEDAEAFKKVAYAFSKAESDFWYISYCRIMEADARNSKMDVEHAIEELLNQMEIVCYMPERVYEIIDKYDVKVALLWDRIAGQQWPSHVSRLVNECEDIYIDKAYDYLLDVYDENDWRAQSLASAFQEKLLIEQEKEEMNALRNQIMEQVKTLLGAGQEQLALQFANQLMVMFPGDKEVEEFVNLVQGKY